MELNYYIPKQTTGNQFLCLPSLELIPAEPWSSSGLILMQSYKELGFNCFIGQLWYILYKAISNSLLYEYNAC